MANTMLVRLDSESKLGISRLAKLEGKTASQIIRELVSQYIREHDISGYIDLLWKRIGEEIRDAGFSEKDISKVIKEVRAKKR